MRGGEDILVRDHGGQFQVGDGYGAVRIGRRDQSGSNHGGKTVAPHNGGMARVCTKPHAAHAEVRGVRGAKESRCARYQLLEAGGTLA